jgi:hypothetical protein
MLIFIAVWSKCLRRKLLRVGAAEIIETRSTEVRASQALHIWKIQKRVNATCSKVCWLRRCAGNLTEIFVIAFT